MGFKEGAVVDGGEWRHGVWRLEKGRVLHMWWKGWKVGVCAHMIHYHSNHCLGFFIIEMNK